MIDEDDNDNQNAALPGVEHADTSTVNDGKTGYKRPPVKSRFRKGQSGNPFGRRKGQRNLPAVLNEILAQTVTVKQGNKSERMTKGEAAIKMIMSKAQNGDRRAIDAVSYLAGKIGRLEDVNSETSPRGGILLVPGMVNTAEEWKAAVADVHAWREREDQKWTLEERRRRNRALMTAQKAELDAVNQGPEQQRAAAKAIAEAEEGLHKPYIRFW
jgi:hypothetical protein